MTWAQITPNDQLADVIQKVQELLKPEVDASPWASIHSVCLEVAQKVMDVLQSLLDGVSLDCVSRTKYMKCIRELRRKYHSIFPSSFYCKVKLSGHQVLTGGGFADIYQGTMDTKVVCVKALRTFQESEQEQKKRATEALVWRQLHHPNILPFIGIDEDLFPASKLCLISPWMKNGNLISFLRNNPTHDRLKSIVQIASGLQYLHEQNPQIVHGDIKGANILVDDDLNCRLADFGLSRFTQTAAPRSSEVVGKGTLQWLAPEILDYSKCRHRFSTAVDIYALGCTIIEIYTGQPPFPYIKNDAALVAEVLLHKKKPPRPPPDVFPSDKLWWLVESCLSSNPESRPSASDILRVLEGLSSSDFTSSDNHGQLCEPHVDSTDKEGEKEGKKKESDGYIQIVEELIKDVADRRNSPILSWLCSPDIPISPSPTMLDHLLEEFSRQKPEVKGSNVSILAGADRVLAEFEGSLRGLRTRLGKDTFTQNASAMAAVARLLDRDKPSIGRMEGDLRELEKLSRGGEAVWISHRTEIEALLASIMRHTTLVLSISVR